MQVMVPYPRPSETEASGEQTPEVYLLQKYPGNI